MRRPKYSYDHPAARHVGITITHGGPDVGTKAVDSTTGDVIAACEYFHDTSEYNVTVRQEIEARIAAKEGKIPIGDRAFRERVRVHLAKQDQAVRRVRGRDVLINVKRDEVIDPDFDIEKFARNAGLLKAYEKLSDWS